MAIAVQSDGRIVIGGGFTLTNGTAQSGLARLHPDGSLDPSFRVNLVDESWPGWVSAMQLQNDGQLLIAGNFSQVNGLARTNLARLNPDASQDLNYNPVVGDPFPTPETEVRAMALQPDGKLIIAGNVSLVNGVRRTNIARLNPGGTLDAGFDPESGVAGFNFNTRVSALALQADGKLIIGGTFDLVNGEPRDHSARLNPDGSLDSFFASGTVDAVFGPFPNDPITVLPQSNGKVVIAGSFANVNGLSAIRANCSWWHSRGVRPRYR